MTIDAELHERRRAALQDLLELDCQVKAGQIDDATAADLRTRYESNVVLATRGLAVVHDRDSAGDVAAEDPPRRSRFRPATAAVIVAGVVALVTLRGSIGARPDGGFVTGNEAVAGRDLSTVTNDEMEAVVTANADVIPMRLRLAHRYLDDGDPATALRHYLEVLDRVDDPEASAHAGWIVFNDGRADLGRQLLEASLELRPDDPEAQWFLANVALFGDEDPAAAMRLLDGLLVRQDLGEQRGQVEDLADVARRELEQQ